MLHASGKTNIGSQGIFKPVKEGIMNNDRYILTGKEPTKCASLIEWGRWMENIDKRKVAHDMVGEARVSTVFLGLDHNWDEGEPILFETMVFSGKRDGEMERYSTWDEAIDGHNRIVESLRNA